MLLMILLWLGTEHTLLCLNCLLCFLLLIIQWAESLSQMLLIHHYVMYTSKCICVQELSAPHGVSNLPALLPPLYIIVVFTSPHLAFIRLLNSYSHELHGACICMVHVFAWCTGSVVHGAWGMHCLFVRLIYPFSAVLWAFYEADSFYDAVVSYSNDSIFDHESVLTSVCTCTCNVVTTCNFVNIWQCVKCGQWEQTPVKRWSINANSLIHILRCACHSVLLQCAL